MSQGDIDRRGESARAGRTDATGWAAIDDSLREFRAASVIPLLSAAIDAPWTQPWQRHLTLLWLRAVSVPPAGGRSATDRDLAELVDVAVEVAGDPIQPSGASNDPRQAVGFTIAGRRWRLHPGDNLYPLITLRRLTTTAQALDSTLLRAIGFTLTDVIEVVLAHGDDLMGGLAEAWAKASEETVTEVAGTPVVSTAAVEAVVHSMAAHRDEHWLTSGLSEPERAARAMAWLTQDADQVSVSDAPGEPLLGAVLRLRSAGAVFPVPASLTLDALNAAADALLRRPEIGDAEADRLRALTYAHAFAVLSKQAVNRSTPLELELSAPPTVIGPRTVTTVVSALNPDDLNDAIRQAIDALNRGVQTEPHTQYALGHDLGPSFGAQAVDAGTRAKVVLYGGPLVVKLHQVRDIVLLHIEELVELVDTSAGDWATVEFFLQDLAEHPGHDLVVFQDILDVWKAWRDWGRIGPPAEPDGGRIDETASFEEAALYVMDAEYDATWVQAVEWEPIDATLAAAGLPEHRDWPVATLETDNAANLFTTSDGMIALVNVDPAIVILIDDADVTLLHLDTDTLFGIADAVRYCITRHDAIAAHFRLTDAPVTIMLNLTPERFPDPESGFGVQVRCAPELALMHIVIGPDLLELLITDPMTGHEVLGTALHQLVDHIRAGRAERAGTPAAAFGEAWRAVGPLMTLQTFIDERPRMAPMDTLPRSRAIRMRALRTVADGLRSRVAPGIYVDGNAHAICRDEILPAIEAVLHDRIAAFDSSLARKVAVRLNAAYATCLRRGHQIAHALTGPWARNWHGAAHDDELPTSVLVLQALLEAVLADPPVGTRTADPLDLGELAALADLLVHAGTTAYGFERDLHGLRVEVDSHGVYVVQSVPASVEDVQGIDDSSGYQDPPIDIDLAAYHRAQRDHVIASAGQKPWSVHDVVEQADGEGALPLGGGRPREPVRFRPLQTFAEPSLLRVDTLLASTWGTGLDGVAAVLGTAVDWPTDDDGIAAVDIDDLVREAADWSELPNAAIRAALHMLQIDADELRGYGARRFLDVERRAHRLATRPLPTVDRQILLMPWLIYAAQQLHNSYLVAARLPQPAQPPVIVNAMTEHRKDRNRELEATVQAIVADLRLPHRLRFSQHEQHTEGIPNPVGEIDLLIADADTSRLWVCEIKDLAAPYSVASMRDHIRKFTHGKRPFVPKLLEKTKQIQRHVEAGARACGVPDKGAWRVIPLMVTRHVEPTAYTKHPRVPFTIPSLLADVLQNPLDPENGPATSTVDR